MIQSYEWRKIFRRPLVLIVLMSMLGFLAGIALLGYYVEPQLHQRVKAEQSLYAGAITPAWAENHSRVILELLDNPQNYLSGEEAQQVRARLEREGYSAEKIDDRLRFELLTPQARQVYESFEDVKFSARFYERALQRGEEMSQRYRSQYPAERGERMAADTLRRYELLANDYTAYYNYRGGYEAFRFLLTLYPYTVGMVLLVALSPLFSGEYALRTVSLQLTSAKGRASLARAKILSGFFATILVWMLATLILLSIVLLLYGAQGAESYWQNWMSDWAPFRWNQMEITLVSLGTSLLGTLMAAALLMLLSAFARSPFVSLVLGGAMMLLTPLLYAGSARWILGKLTYFLPVHLMMGVPIWQPFELFYLFGQPVPAQYVSLGIGVLLTLLSIPLAIRRFRSYQVKN